MDAGWYNDGDFNDYRYNNNKKAAWTELEITGAWQNLHIVVTKLEPVVYFSSAEALKAYQNDHSKTEGILHSTTARVGSTLPTADAPTATRPGYTFKFWSREGQSTDVSGQTVNGWTNLYANWEKKTYNVVAKLKVNGELAYDLNDDLYTHTVSGKFEEAIDFASIEAWALDLAENTVHPGAASYTVEYEDGTEASLCSTYGQHEIDQETHTIYVNVKTTEHVYVYKMVDGVMQPTEYHHSAAPYGANVIAYLNENVKNLDMEEYTHDEWFKKDGSTLGAKFEEDEAIHGRTDVVIQYTKAEYPVTYSYVSADPTVALPQAVLDTLPKNEFTYTTDEWPETAAKPDDVTVGEYVWKFVTWKLDGVEVAPRTKVQMVSGGLHFEGVWERERILYTLTIKYVDRSGNDMATSKVLKLAAGAEYEENSPYISGYRADRSVVKGTMPSHDLTETVVYTRKRSTSSGGTTVVSNPLKFNTKDHFAYVEGYPDGTVRPEGNITRAEVAAILYRIMDDTCVEKYKTIRSSYQDVARGDWFNTYVATLENAGVIVDTRSGGYFRPNEAITRAELATMLAQFAATGTSSASKFKDVASSHWASKEIGIAAKMGWIEGYPDGSFRPDQTITRAEMMAMVNRALERTPESEDDLLSGMKTWSDNARVSAWYYLDVQEATNSHTYTKRGTHETWKKLTN